MPSKKEESARHDLERVMRSLKPGEAHEIKDATGKVVATLGVPSAQRPSGGVFVLPFGRCYQAITGRFSEVVHR